MGPARAAGAEGEVHQGVHFVSTQWLMSPARLHQLLAAENPDWDDLGPGLIEFVIRIISFQDKIRQLISNLILH